MEQQPPWRQRLDTLGFHAYEVGLLVNEILQLPAADRELAVDHNADVAVLALKARLHGTAPDATSTLLERLALPEATPSIESLPGWYACIEETYGNRSPLLRMKDGTAFKLPVHPALYHRLRFDSVAQELVEPDYLSQAWVLSSAVSAALYHSKSGVLGDAIPVKLEDEMSMAYHYDELFWQIIAVADQLDRRRSGLPRLTRKRNCPDASLPLELSRPGVLLKGGGAILLKGEEKPWVPIDAFDYPGARSEAWSMVIEELMAKARDRKSYHVGEHKYQLCCGAVGSQFQMFYMQRRTQHNNLETTCTPLGNMVDDTTRITDKIRVIHAALLTQRIITLQLKDVSSHLTHIGSSGSVAVEEEQVQRNGTRLLFADGYVVKTVPAIVFDQHGVKPEALEKLYAAVKHSKYVVHALQPPTLDRQAYRVYIEPRGAALRRPSFDSADRLKTAIRCILHGVQDIHSAGMGHADLSWSNIIATEGAPQFAPYCIIDLELAQKLGKPPSFRLDNFMPRVWQDGKALVDGCYVAASDLFLVGQMLYDALDHNYYHGEWLPQARDLAQQLTGMAISVEDALQHPWLQQAPTEPALAAAGAVELTE